MSWSHISCGCCWVGLRKHRKRARNTCGSSFPPKLQSPAVPLIGKPCLEPAVKGTQEAELGTEGQSPGRGWIWEQRGNQPAQPLPRKSFMNIFISRLKRNSHTYHTMKPFQILFISSNVLSTEATISLPISPLCWALSLSIPVAVFGSPIPLSESFPQELCPKVTETSADPYLTMPIKDGSPWGSLGGHSGGFEIGHRVCPSVAQASKLPSRGGSTHLLKRRSSAGALLFPFPLSV